MYTIIIVPYRISFIETESKQWDDFELFIDVSFIFDVLVNCFSAVYINEDLIVDHVAILKLYAKGWMALDILSAIPLNLIISGSHWGAMTKLVKFPRMYRVVKVAKIMRVSSLSQKLSSIGCLEFLSHLSLQTKRLLYFFMSFTLLCHLLTCLWFFISSLNPEMNWVLKYHFTDKTSFEQYSASLYWVVTTLATVGYGDITASNSTERAMCILVMLLGVFFYSYTVGTISNIMSGLDRELQKVNSKLLILQNIRREFKLGKKLTKRIIDSLKLNKSSTSEDFSDLLKNLPRRLSLQLNFTINKKLMQKSNKFFRKKPIAFITIVLECLKSIKLPLKEVIFSKGDVSNEIYFISKGEISIYDEFRKNEINFEVLTEGEYFGEDGVLLNENRLFYSKTTRVAELMILGKDSLIEALNVFPYLREEMAKEANKRKINYLRKSAKFSREFINNRKLVKSLTVKENLNRDELDSKAYNIRMFNSIKNSLSQKAQKLVQIQKSANEILMDKLLGLEKKVIKLKEKAGKC